MTEKIQSYRGTHEERGATLVEFALSVGLFVLALLAFFDFAHYYLVRMLLLRAAHQALSVAVTDPRLQEDFAADSALMASKPYADYSAARSDVLHKASAYPFDYLISPPDGEGLVTLTTFRAHDESQGGVLEVDNLKAAVLRPGEAVTSDLDGRLIEHPSLCSATLNSNCTNTRPVNSQMRDLLQSYPLVVVVRARKRSLLAWWHTFPVTVAAVGWAQLYPQSPFDLQDLASNAPVPPMPTLCPRTPADCRNWRQDTCQCTDEQPCEAGQHWNPNGDLPRCSTCPFAESYVPGKAPANAPTCPAGYRFIDWSCTCDCPEGMQCRTSGQESNFGSTCQECLPLDDTGQVGR